MSTYRLPLAIATRPSLLLRLWRRLREAFAPSACRHAVAADVICDWTPLRDLPDSLQRDIGVPASLRDHAQALRERDTMWLRIQ